MNIDFRGLAPLHLWGESATHPIRPPSGALAAQARPCRRAACGVLAPCRPTR
ncbi:MAG: hypothetical protein LBE78_05145 [Burkholderiaceae bacterium]|nr:hypothetical protein [Burkholderiaceae bacterium]